MKSSQLITFENSILGTIRGFVDKDGEPRFLAGQVCRCLGIKDSTSAVKQAEERMKIAENYYSKVGQVSNRAYSNFSRLVNRSLGLPYHIDRGSLPAETLERIAKRENPVQAMVAEGRKYGEIKSFIENFTE